MTASLLAASQYAYPVTLLRQQLQPAQRNRGNCSAGVAPGPPFRRSCRQAVRIHRAIDSVEPIHDQNLLRAPLGNTATTSDAGELAPFIDCRDFEVVNRFWIEILQR